MAAGVVDRVPRALTRELAEEFDFHLEMETRRIRDGGLPTGEARRRAERAFGGVARHKDAVRDERGTGPLEDVAQDLRFAVRSLRRRAGFTAVAALTLALGVGATTALFGVVKSVLLAPLPYGAPDGVAVVFAGGASKLGLGNPPERVDLVVSTERLDQVLEHAAGDLVVRVQGGARLAELRGALPIERAVVERDRHVPDRSRDDLTIAGIVGAGNDNAQGKGVARRRSTVRSRSPFHRLSRRNNIR